MKTLKFTINPDDHAEDIINEIDSCLADIGLTIQTWNDNDDGTVDYRIVKIK